MAAGMGSKAGTQKVLRGISCARGLCRSVGEGVLGPTHGGISPETFAEAEGQKAYEQPAPIAVPSLV